MPAQTPRTSRSSPFNKEAPRELPVELYEKVVEQSEEGSKLFDGLDFHGALARFESALALVPEPKADWNASMWILAGIGDCHFFLKDFERARAALEAALQVRGAIGNTFLHLRLGETLFELSLHDRAANELIRAYATGGPEAFVDEDPKYLEFLGSRADLESHRS